MQDFLRNTVSNVRAVFRNRRKRFIKFDVLDQDVSCIQNTYSPSIVHRELVNSTRTQLGYRSGDVKAWQNVAKKKLKEIIKEEIQSLIKKEGLDKDDKEKLASLEKQETALAAERSKSDSNALEKKHKALKDKIKALKDKEHQ